MEFIPFEIDQKDARYFPYHKKKGHTSEWCFTSKGIFDEKHKASEILFQEGIASISDLAFPKHMTKAICQAVMAFHSKMKIEKDEQQAHESERDLDLMAQQSRIC